MRILVTGAAGFLGSHLCDFLIKQGHDVIGLDNFFTGSRENLSQLRHQQRFELIRHDVVEPIVIEGVEQIYHAACPASPVHYQANSVRTMRTAAIGTMNMLDMARELRARFMLFSTSEIYGDPQVSPQHEGYFGNVDCRSIRACYSADTEVMTLFGWKLFSDLTSDDIVAALTESNMIAYVKPTEIIQQRYAGDMIHFKNSKLDLLVTPNHKMIEDRLDHNDRRFVEAGASVSWRSRYYPVSCTWPEYTAPLTYKLAEPVRNAKVTFDTVPLDDFLTFVGMYLADGCTTVTRKTKIVDGKAYETSDHRILIAHDHGWKYGQIKACLAKLPWKYTELDHQFQIVNRQLFDTLEAFGHRSLEKRIPREILDLPPSKLQLLFDGVMFDGRRDGRAFYSSSRDLVDAVHEIALKLGKAAHISIAPAGANPYSDRDGYRLNLRAAERGSYPDPVRVPYNGDVWCVTAPPYHTLLVRRNGKSAFCGNCYDEGKRVGEAMVVSFAREFNLDTRTVRIFNTHGPRMAENDGRVVSNFVLQALDGDPLTIYGEGMQTRSLCYVSDLVDGLVRLMNTPTDPGPVNLGNPHEVTMIQLAKRVIELTGSKSDIVHRTLPKADPTRRCPDISKAREVLGWEPFVGLDEGLRGTINYFYNRRSQMR